MIAPLYRAKVTGIFSLDFLDAKNGLVVGGNYLKDKDNANNVLQTKNGGKTWNKPQNQVSGYRSGVKYITKYFCVATGTSGTDISTNGGKKWQNISTLSFNAIETADDTIILVGGKGNIGRLVTLP